MEMLEHLDAVQQSFASAPQHPLKEKAHSITAARPTVVAKTSASISSALVLVKLKPMPKKVTHQLKKKETYTSSKKGKGKAIVAQENKEEAVEVNQGKVLALMNSTKTSKQPKVTQESVLPKHNAVKDDITMDMAPQVLNFELVAVALTRNLNVLMPKPTLVNKVKCNPTQVTSGWQKHPQMDVDDSHNGLMKVLEGMMLEVMQDSVNLSAWNVTLQEISQTLQTNIAQLTAENTATTEQLNALQDRITTQDAAILELHCLRAEVMVLQYQVKTLQEESATSTPFSHMTL
ncbi:hypothetical protein BDR06DRAFT_972296 [Suillus hirtellus]|nr:hypothetical protein BDR06DRAFT_972296 [Suillus hirtellus]